MSARALVQAGMSSLSRHSVHSTCLGTVALMRKRSWSVCDQKCGCWRWRRTCWKSSGLRCGEEPPETVMELTRAWE